MNYFSSERPSNLRQNNYSFPRWLADKSSQSLETIRESLVNNQYCDSIQLLKLYQEILLRGEVTSNQSEEQRELLRLGLVVNRKDQLKVASKVYRVVFNPSWVDETLASLDPYKRIKLKLLKLDEKASLPYRLLTELLLWTGNQPFLLQKVVQILEESDLFIAAGEEATQLAPLIQNRIIDHWPNQVAGDHLKEIRNDLLNNQQCEPLSLLRLYQKILKQTVVPTENAPAAAELVKLGLVTQQQGQLQVANRIYQAVFNAEWLEEQIREINPSSETVSVPILEEQSLAALDAVSKTPDTHPHGQSKIKWLIIALILLGTGLFSLRFFMQGQDEKLFQQANNQYIEGNYQEAITQYNQVLDMNANYYEAWTNRGYAFAGLKDYQKMLDSCASATIIEAQAVYAWNCQGEAFYNLQEYDSAIAAFNQAIDIEPNNPLFWINKAESLIANQENNQALAVLDHAIQLLETAQNIEDQERIRKLAIAFTHQGKALSYKQEYESALQAYNQALAYVPDYFTAQRNIGIVFQKLDRCDEALVHFNQILNHPELTNAQKAEISYYRGLSLIDLSRNQEAVAAFDEALALKPEYSAAAKAKMRLVMSTVGQAD